MSTPVVAPAAAGAPAGRLPAVLRPLRIRDFRLVWAGEGISLFGDQFHFVALTWLALELTGSGLALGTILMAAAVPRGVLMLVGGAFTDRFAPRAVMLASNVLRAVVVAVLATIVLSGRVEVWHLMALGAAFGVLDAFFYPAMGAIVPHLVPPDRLAAANAVHQGTIQLMSLIGPAAAGVFVAAVGIGQAFAIDAATFAVAAIAISLVGGARRPLIDPTGDAAARPGLVATIREGAAYTFRDPGIRALILLSTAANFAFTGSVSVGLPWLVDVRFGGSSIDFGFLFASFGAGALVGSIVAGTVPRPRRFGWLTMGIGAWLGVGLASLGLMPNVLATGIVLALMGLTVGWVNVAAMSWIQARVDPDKLGRVMSLLMLGSFGLAPLSLGLAGAIVDANATLMFAAAGGVLLAAVAAGLLSGAQRRLD
jgi:MFS family permease